MWWTSWAIIIVVALWNFVSTFISIFVCSPREKFWNNLITDGWCLDYASDIVATSAFNIVCDLLIWCLPMRAVWRLQIPTRRKVAIVSVFAIGLL